MAALCLTLLFLVRISVNDIPQAINVWFNPVASAPASCGLVQT